MCMKRQQKSKIVGAMEIILVAYFLINTVISTSIEPDSMLMRAIQNNRLIVHGYEYGEKADVFTGQTLEESRIVSMSSLPGNIYNANTGVFILYDIQQCNIIAAAAFDLASGSYKQNLKLLSEQIKWFRETALYLGLTSWFVEANKNTSKLLVAEHSDLVQAFGEHWTYNLSENWNQYSQHLIMKTLHESKQPRQGFYDELLVKCPVSSIVAIGFEKRGDRDIASVSGIAKVWENIYHEHPDRNNLLFLEFSRESDDMMTAIDWDNNGTFANIHTKGCVDNYDKNIMVRVIPYPSRWSTKDLLIICGFILICLLIIFVKVGNTILRTIQKK
eukprot:235570_1